MEIEDIRPIHSLFREYICSGLAFGVTRKLSALQRACERLTCLIDAANSFSHLGGGEPSTRFTISSIVIYMFVVPQVTENNFAHVFQ